MKLTQYHILKVMPNAGRYLGRYLPYINEYADLYKINTPLRMAHYLTQIAIESGEMSRVNENLSYSASRLITVFPTRISKINANRYAYNPVGLANYVYANRYGNGDPSSGDGYKYRGRGLIQITFKNNYKAYSDYLAQKEGQVVNLLINPELLEMPKGAAKSSMWVFNTFGCNELADKDDLKGIRKKINGSKNSEIEAAKTYLKRAKEALGIG